MIAQGFAKGDPNTSLFWHSADLSLYRLFESQPGYDYYVTVEYDAIVNGDADRLVAAVAAKNYDFVGQEVAKAVAEWPWTKTCNRIYDPAILRPYLNAIAFYSARAVPVLRDRRLDPVAALPRPGNRPVPDIRSLHRDGIGPRRPDHRQSVRVRRHRRVMTGGRRPTRPSWTWWAHDTFIHPVLGGGALYR